MENELNKTEKATPKQRQRARSQGQVARSAEISSLGGIAAATIALAWLGPVLGHNMIDFTRITLASVRDGVVEIPGREVLFSMPCTHMIGAAVAWMGVCAVAALITGFGQVGFEFAGGALEARWGNLDPIAGMKKLFSVQSAVRALAS